MSAAVKMIAEYAATQVLRIALPAAVDRAMEAERQRIAAHLTAYVAGAPTR
jgi:hypothetical protein